MIYKINLEYSGCINIEVNATEDNEAKFCAEKKFREQGFINIDDIVVDRRIIVSVEKEDDLKKREELGQIIIIK
jgi:hypothetical protein